MKKFYILQEFWQFLPEAEINICYRSHRDLIEKLPLLTTAAFHTVKWRLAGWTRALISRVRVIKSLALTNDGAGGTYRVASVWPLDVESSTKQNGYFRQLCSDCRWCNWWSYCSWWWDTAAAVDGSIDALYSGALFGAVAERATAFIGDGEKRTLSQNLSEHRLRRQRTELIFCIVVVVDDAAGLVDQLMMKTTKTTTRKKSVGTCVPKEDQTTIETE